MQRTEQSMPSERVLAGLVAVVPGLGWAEEVEGEEEFEENWW